MSAIQPITITELVLDDRPATLGQELPETIQNTRALSVEQRLEAVYPSADQLFVIAASADHNTMPGACVITEVQQILDCPNR